MKNKIPFDSVYCTIFDKIESQGGKVYIVGGIVRDFLLFNENKQEDIDVEIYNLTIDQLENILSSIGTVSKIGKSFGILKIKEYPEIDFALPRIEKQIGVGHKSFDIQVNPTLSCKEASIRRDFTINAFMYDYHQEEIIDFYHGFNDLKTGILRMVDVSSFQEDPLRVYRLAQFMSRYNMFPSDDTKKQCVDMVMNGSLEHLSKERILGEYTKLLLGKKPSQGLMFLYEIGILPKLSGHQYENINTQRKDSRLLFCILLEIYEVNYFGVPPKIVKYSKELSNSIKECIKVNNKHTYYQFLHKIGSNLKLEDVLSMLDILQRNKEKDTLEYYVSIYGNKEIEPMIKGEDLLSLGIPASKELGDLYEDCYQKQLSGYSKEELVQYIKEIKR